MHQENRGDNPTTPPSCNLKTWTAAPLPFAPPGRQACAAPGTRASRSSRCCCPTRTEDLTPCGSGKRAIGSAGTGAAGGSLPWIATASPWHLDSFPHWPRLAPARRALGRPTGHSHPPSQRIVARAASQQGEPDQQGTGPAAQRRGPRQCRPSRLRACWCKPRYKRPAGLP
jgi:hypothetical protein